MSVLRTLPAQSRNLHDISGNSLTITVSSGFTVGDNLMNRELFFPFFHLFLPFFSFLFLLIFSLFFFYTFFLFFLVFSFFSFLYFLFFHLLSLFTLFVFFLLFFFPPFFFFFFCGVDTGQVISSCAVDRRSQRAAWCPRRVFSGSCSLHTNAPVFE